MSVSFLPPMLANPRLQGNDTANTLLPPETTPTGGEANLDFPPVTPMPRPSVRDGDEQYAGVDGQLVWEGDVVDKYKLFKDENGGWVAVWKGEVQVGKSGSLPIRASGSTVTDHIASVCEDYHSGSGAVSYRLGHSTRCTRRERAQEGKFQYRDCVDTHRRGGL